MNAWSVTVTERHSTGLLLVVHTGAAELRVLKWQGLPGERFRRPTFVDCCIGKRLRKEGHFRWAPFEWRRSHSAFAADAGAMVAAVAKRWPIWFRFAWGGLRTAYWIPRTVIPNTYADDSLISFQAHAFQDDPAFQRAYQRGVSALGGKDIYRWEWRVHVGLWAAASASHLDGDFVECGVSYGFLSSAIMEYLDWDRLGKTFYLLDTFAGLDPRFITDGEREAGALVKSQSALEYGTYVDSVDSVRANFAEWRNQRIIAGAVPETLDQVDARAVAYLHIDMNCAPPEIATLRYFWPRLTPGAFVLLDDYANRGRDEQRLAMDALAGELGVPICALPTGQGLLIKPAR